MKISILFTILPFLLSSKNSFSQKKTAELLIEIGSQPLYPSLLDSVIFYNDTGKVVKTLTNVTTDKGMIKVNLEHGFYNITMKAKGYKFRDTDCATVCSLCANKIRFACFKADERRIFSLPRLSPYYPGRGKIARDFTAVMSEDEVNNLKKWKDFTISFFITRDTIMSDIILHVKKLPGKNRKAILKGLSNLKGWRLAEANGKSAVDGYVSIPLSTLLYGYSRD